MLLPCTQQGSKQNTDKQNVLGLCQPLVRCGTIDLCRSLFRNAGTQDQKRSQGRCGGPANVCCRQISGRLALARFDGPRRPLFCCQRTTDRLLAALGVRLENLGHGLRKPHSSREVLVCLGVVGLLLAVLVFGRRLLRVQHSKNAAAAKTSSVSSDGSDLVLHRVPTAGSPVDLGMVSLSCFCGVECVVAVSALGPANLVFRLDFIGSSSSLGLTE